MRCAVRDLDPASLTPAEAREQLDWFTEIERLAAAGKTILAARAVEDEPWRWSGQRDGAAWLATRTDCTIGEARAVLNTAERLPRAPAAGAVFRRGELSVAKADQILTATAIAPDAEARLLDAAAHGSLKRVRDESAKVRAAADPDPAATHARIHRNRMWRRWTDADGSRCGLYRVTPEVGAMIEAAAQPFVDAVVDDARRTGNDDAYDALAADGLGAMARHQLEGDASEPPTARGARGRKRLRNRRELIALVDLAALRRGHAHPGERCEIAGVGPVPVDVARDVFGDALLRIVVRDGADVKTVVHTGRTASAVQETAVLVQQDGCCGIPYCDQPATEIDHGAGFRVSGPVALGDLIGACGHHHDQKTNHGYTWRRDPDHSIVWVHPDGTEERQRPPP